MFTKTPRGNPSDSVYTDRKKIHAKPFQSVPMSPQGNYSRMSIQSKAIVTIATLVSCVAEKYDRDRFRFPEFAQLPHSSESLLSDPVPCRCVKRPLISLLWKLQPTASTLTGFLHRFDLTETNKT